MKPADVLRRMPASIREVCSARGDEPYHLYVRDGDRWVDKGPCKHDHTEAPRTECWAPKKP